MAHGIGKKTLTALSFLEHKENKMEVVSVNHGKQFGYDNWYTFYCPECNRQVSSQQKKCECGGADVCHECFDELTGTEFDEPE